MSVLIGEWQDAFTRGLKSIAPGALISGSVWRVEKDKHIYRFTCLLWAGGKMEHYTGEMPIAQTHKGKIRVMEHLGRFLAEKVFVRASENQLIN